MEIKMNDQQILRSLAGTICVCGEKKGSRKSHCRGCYFALPPEKKQALYYQFNFGYQEAFLDSIKYLQKIGRVTSAQPEYTSTNTGDISITMPKYFEDNEVCGWCGRLPGMVHEPSCRQ